MYYFRAMISIIWTYFPIYSLAVTKLIFLHHMTRMSFSQLVLTQRENNILFIGSPNSQNLLCVRFAEVSVGDTLMSKVTSFPRGA